MDGRVAIIGGGIGGLSAALALTRRGVQCTVYERAPELREIGAGIGLWPAPLRVYDELGIGDDVRALAGEWKVAGVRSWDGRPLVTYTADEFAARLGEPTSGMHRGELQALLLRSLPPGTVHAGKELVEATSGPGRVSARFADGSSVEAAALIGADGRRSAVREGLFGPRRLKVYGVGWRGTCVATPGTDWNLFTGESWGTDGRFGFLPISGDRMTWYAAASEVRRDGGLDEVRERFSHWHDPIPALIDATPPDQLWFDALDDIRPLRHWTSGRVALLGDAAHPMTPDLGQGACQAILDAWVLAQELAHARDVPDALHAYERRRRTRANLVTRVARAATKGTRNESRVAVAARVRVASLVPGPLMLRAFTAMLGGPLPARASGRTHPR